MSFRSLTYHEAWRLIPRILILFDAFKLGLMVSLQFPFVLKPIISIIKLNFEQVLNDV
jgi:hypothetical protein